MSEPDLSDPSLRELRAQVKKTMLPLLIRIFELKLAMQQAQHPPSRLQKKPAFTALEIREQLASLKGDLKSLLLWIQSADKQIERALSEIDDPQEPLDKERIQSTPLKASPLTKIKKWIWKK